MLPHKGRYVKIERFNRKQRDQMDRLFIQSLAIDNNKKLSSSIKMPKLVQKFAKY